jgi:hypothetical protein
MSFPQDTSLQLSYSSFPFTTPALDGYTTSNYVSTVSNLLITNINLRQPNLTAATNLVGIGSAITAIDYNSTLSDPIGYLCNFFTNGLIWMTVFNFHFLNSVAFYRHGRQYIHYIYIYIL